ncbi:DnaJ domain-containing protein [Paraburkholderia sp. SARCC-3016]|uniref:J domain-containing protein n=1 Tax=Paraburkholderia sp. SARCC-3016 TaxID=3058611 RepID=UPI00280A250D|nr:DnaJ domain-containing protein [Paraburkholderia sp. SARCC-3016]MDQ7977223.1 DnaJ domain-containing protein [Paraburkholderia sp. SARCC-3016]
MATLYTKLGVAEDASAAEIKRAYRKAAMKWHPDRNAGNEEAARATFLDIKDAYEILSDPDKRKVYDSVYATEMHRWETQQQRRHEQQRQHREHQHRQHAQQQQQQRDREKSERARRERAEQVAAEAKYQERVSFAMRFAEQGHNRDVLFGVLLGRDCPPEIAARIADSVSALQQARVGAARAAAATRKRRPAPRAYSAATSTAPRAAGGKADAHGKKPSGFFDSLWHSFFGVRS